VILGAYLGLVAAPRREQAGQANRAPLANA
jgi:hypothetical protein